MLILVKIIFFMIDYSLLKPKWNCDTDHCSRLKYSFRTTLCCPRYGHKFMFSLKGKVRILLVIVVHIFQNAQVTWNKMVYNKKPPFSNTTFYILWHGMTCFVASVTSSKNHLLTLHLWVCTHWSLIQDTHSKLSSAKTLVISSIILKWYLRYFKTNLKHLSQSH